MINFRFHVVSLIAIFLALALGVVVGAGVIDRGVVNTLNSRLDQVESKSDRIQSENSALRGQLGTANDGIVAMQPHAVAGALTGQKVAVVAVRGIDQDRVQATVDASKQAGADVTGVLWIEGKWSLGNDADTRALGTAVADTSRKGSALRNEAWKKIAQRLDEPPAVVADQSSPDLLAALSDAGFVSYDAGTSGMSISAFPGRDASFVLLVGENGNVKPDDVVTPAATAFSGQGMTLVVGDVYADLPTGGVDRGVVFDQLRASDLARTVSTVNDVDLQQGPTTVVLTLAGLLCVPPIVGHYGSDSPDTKNLPDPVGAGDGGCAAAQAR
jgi:Copper transport outer membrane protein, MctB